LAAKTLSRLNLLMLFMDFAVCRPSMDFG